MADVTASRTLVKSHPELWTECSDAGSLARHLDRFGEIKITRLEPETAVAWEGEHASGTVRLEPSGWGTRVVMTATPVSADGEAPAAEPVVAEPVVAEPVVPRPDPAAPRRDPVAPGSRRGFLRRLLGRFGAGNRRRTSVGIRAPEATGGSGPVTAGPVASEPVTPEAVAREPVASRPPLPEPVTEPPNLDSRPDTPGDNTADALQAALDSLGQAHRRPFSRS